MTDNQQVLHDQLGQLGIDLDLVKVSVSPLAKVLYFNYKNVCDFDKRELDRAVEEMSMYNHCRIDWKKGTDTHIILTRYYDQPTIYLSQLLTESNYRDIVVGKDIENKLVSIDFNQCPHILIAGTTGSGKSVLMNNIILNLYCHYAQTGSRFNDMNIILIDPKGCEFDKYKYFRNTKFIDETNEAINYLAKACDEMDYRYHNMNKNFADLYIVIDELADLMLTSQFEVEQYIVRLAQKGRQCGIHLIVATQSPRVAVITGLIKANITTKFILKVASIREAVLCLDHKGAEILKGNGDCLVKFPYKVDEVRFQVAMYTPQLISQIKDMYNHKR